MFIEPIKSCPKCNLEGVMNRLSTCHRCSNCGFEVLFPHIVRAKVPDGAQLRENMKIQEEPKDPLLYIFQREEKYRGQY